MTTSKPVRSPHARIAVAAVVASLVLAAAGRVAAADDPPWAAGVSNDRQARANQLFEAGNALFAQLAHGPAVDKYRAALALWDHPLIRFNLAVGLIRLDRVLEAAAELEAALRFGATPFTRPLYQQALDYQRLLKGRVGYVAASCDQAGVRVMLDGKPWFGCPGSRRQRVLSGEHAVVGERDGYLSNSHRVIVVGGEVAQATLRLVSLESAVRLAYRFPRWLPWAIASAGTVVGGTGLAVWISGRNAMDQFERDFALECANGCSSSATGPHPISPPLAAERAHARRLGAIGVSMMVVGGAVTAGGVVLAIINRPRRVLPDVEIDPSTGAVSAGIAGRF